MTTYTVFVDHVQNQANIHKSTCRFLRQHGGVASTSPPGTWYVDAFQSIEDAGWVAKRQPGVSKITYCGPCFDQS